MAWMAAAGAVLAGTDMLWSGWRNAPRFAAQFFFGGLRSKIRANLGMQYTQAYLSQPSGALHHGLNATSSRERMANTPRDEAALFCSSLEAMPHLWT